MVEHDDHGYANATLAVEVFERSRGGSNLALGTTLWVLVSLAFLELWDMSSTRVAGTCAG